MGIKHKFVSDRRDGPEDGDVQPSHWNADHEIDGVLSEFLSLAATPNSILSLDANGHGAVTTLAALVTLLSALSLSGGTMTGDIAMGSHRVTGLADPALSQDAATKAYVDALATLVSGALLFKGSWDASSGAFPGTTGRKTGWFYKVSVAGTVGGQAFEVGDDIYAIVDNASTSTYAANWLKIEGTVSLAEIQAAIGFTLGAAAARAVGTSVGNLVEVLTGGKLPALDGSNLFNLPAAGGSVSAAQISDASANGRSLITAASYSVMRTLLGLATVATSGAYSDLSGKPTLGTAAAIDVGTTASKVVQLDGSARLPAVDGSQLTSLPTVPAGLIGVFPATAAPTGWLKLNGALVSRTTYAALYFYAAASGNIVAEASWSTNKGAFSTGDTSTTFRLPDLRGVFIRGWDDSAGVDTSRAIGSSQADDFKAHTHPLTGVAASSAFVGRSDADTSGALAGNGNTGTAPASGGTETRPKNVALLACIKY